MNNNSHVQVNTSVELRFYESSSPSVVRYIFAAGWEELEFLHPVFGADYSSETPVLLARVTRLHTPEETSILVATVKISQMTVVFKSHKVISRLESPLKFIYSSDILVLTVSCKIINFVFRTLQLSIHQLSAGFTSDTLQIIPFYFN